MYTFNEVLEKSKEYFKGDELAASVFATKYALANSDNEYLEATPDAMHRRLAKEFARIEEKFPNPMSEKEIYNLLKDFKKIVPQGSPMSGIGNYEKIQSLSNCFVIESPHDSYGGILKTDQEQVQLMKRRGGVGFDVSSIRPKGLPTSNASKTTDGIGVFMERFSNSCREVAQGGRRGALMLTIDVHHPDIETFIEIKRDLSKVTGANISIRISDEFMNAVANNENVELRFPVDPNKNRLVTHQIDAKYLWMKIVEAAHYSAEPGVLFWDNVLRWSPTQSYKNDGFHTISTNPCITGDTEVETNAGKKTVKELADNNAHFYVKSFNVENQEVEMKPAIAFKTKEDAHLLKITTKSGKVIKLTPDHRVYTDHGWIEAGDLTLEHKILGVEKELNT